MRGRSTHDVGSASPRTRASSGRSPRARGVPDRTFRACAAPVLSSWAQRAARSRRISSGVSQCAVRPALSPGLRSRHAGGCPGAGRARHGRVLDDGDAGGLRAGARLLEPFGNVRGAGPAPVVDRRRPLGLRRTWRCSSGWRRTSASSGKSALDFGRVIAPRRAMRRSRRSSAWRGRAQAAARCCRSTP